MPKKRKVKRKAKNAKKRAPARRAKAKPKPAPAPAEEVQESGGHEELVLNEERDVASATEPEPAPDSSFPTGSSSAV